MRCFHNVRFLRYSNGPFLAIGYLGDCPFEQDESNFSQKGRKVPKAFWLEIDVLHSLILHLSLLLSTTSIKKNKYYGNIAYQFSFFIKERCLTARQFISFIINRKLSVTLEIRLMTAGFFRRTYSSLAIRARKEYDNRALGVVLCGIGLKTGCIR